MYYSVRQATTKDAQIRERDDDFSVVCIGLSICETSNGKGTVKSIQLVLRRKAKVSERNYLC